MKSNTVLTTRLSFQSRVDASKPIVVVMPADSPVAGDYVVRNNHHCGRRRECKYCVSWECWERYLWRVRFFRNRKESVIERDGEPILRGGSYLCSGPPYRYNHYDMSSVTGDPVAISIGYKPLAVRIYVRSSGRIVAAGVGRKPWSTCVMKCTLRVPQPLCLQAIISAMLLVLMRNDDNLY